MDRQPVNETPAQLWALYEQQVVATQMADRTYQRASAIAAELFRQYRDAARVRDEAQEAWDTACKERNRLYDAYWATYDQSVA
jgi:hypothetical protein